MKKDPTLTCLRQVSQSVKNGALIMATSDAHAREVAADLRQRGYVADRCGKFVATDAPFRKAARASRIKK